MKYLATLHKIWFSHGDLKKIFKESNEYEKLYNEILVQRNIQFDWISEEKKQKIISNIDSIKVLEVWKIILEKEIKIITIHDEIYPIPLKAIKQAPFLLYIRWKFPPENRLLGIVGSRKSTNYGKKILENFIPKLVEQWFWIVSGGAYGIDAISHDLTIRNQWYTLSVFWCWVDVYYPIQNKNLFEEIIKKWWALLSIFPLWTQAESYMFPIRNEIVAWLSEGIIIPEAGIKSGTLITANLALEHGRDVFAVPGDITRETSMGTNSLIAKGEAKCIQTVDDILEEYLPTIPDSQVINTQKLKRIIEIPEQISIEQVIIDGYGTPDDISEKTGIAFEVVIMNLTLMELSGFIRLNSNGIYEIS